MNETEAADGYIIGLKNELAVAHRDLRVAELKLRNQEEEIRRLQKETKARETVIRDLRKALVGEMSNLDRDAYVATARVEHICGQCRTTFTSAKSWSKFCSSKCRLRAFRARSQPEPTAPQDRELAAISQIMDLLKDIEVALGPTVSRRIAHYIYQRSGA